MAVATADLLRLATAGSVDDGKSTLIGRLLYDSKAVLQDQLEQVEEASRRRHGDGAVDLSLLTDGLRAEREQGITIDVAYRYFASARRRFILADTPGHVQYTRNMVTGASTADLAIVLVDARNGVVEQTKRHAFIASLLGIPHLVLAVNKMDLVGYDEERFDAISRDFASFARALGCHDIAYIPMSALHGDNVVQRSEMMPWYAGPALLEHLEGIEVEGDREGLPLRFPVQWVIRPPGSDYRGYAGEIVSGSVRPGDEVVVLPSGRRTTVEGVDTFEGPVEEAQSPQSVTIRLAEDLDVSRGAMIAQAENPPRPTRQLEATVCWMAETPLRPRTRLLVKHTTATVRAIVDGVHDRLDVHTLRAESGPGELELNDIGRVDLRTSAPVMTDPYAENRGTGAFILIDEATNDTVGAGMVAAPQDPLAP
jgi:bifunctional enzyme CysN/CysC